MKPKYLQPILMATLATLMTCSSVVGQAAPGRRSNFRIPNRKQVAEYPSTPSSPFQPLAPPEHSVVPSFRVTPKGGPPPGAMPTNTSKQEPIPSFAIQSRVSAGNPTPASAEPPIPKFQVSPRPVRIATRPTIESPVAPQPQEPAGITIKSRIGPEDVTPSSIAPPSMTMPFFQLTETPVEPPAPTIIEAPDSSGFRSLRLAEIPRPGNNVIDSGSFPITEAPPFGQFEKPVPADEEVLPTTVGNTHSAESVADNSTPTSEATDTTAGTNTATETGSTPTGVYESGDVFTEPFCDEFVYNEGFDDFGVPFDERAFCPDPQYDHLPFRPDIELGIYEQKWNQCSQRPLIELGRGIYRNGPVPESYSFLGDKNLITPGFNVFGDFRTAVAINDNGAGNPVGVWANRLNLDFDLRLTATERIHAFLGPLDRGNDFTRLEYSTDGADNLEFFEEFDDDLDTIFFEGDLGYIWGGFTDQWAPFDLPFVFGKFPLLFANGIWINDAVEGFAFTIPARNSALLDWTNFEFTFFGILDDINSPAFGTDNSAADAFGFNAFIEAYGGYTEIGYAHVDDRTGQGLSYHNLTFSHTRRFFERISNSVRVIVNAGQDPVNGPQTADGQLILIENSLVSSNPTYFVPYLNLFAGFDQPQSLATLAGPLINTGINFETDLLTGFPRLTDTGEDAWGGAFGFNLLGPRFKWQWVLEAAMLQSFGDSPNGDEYAVGSRFQLPINYSWLVRFDAMYGLRETAADISGVRAELRWKF